MDWGQPIHFFVYREDYQKSGTMQNPDLEKRKVIIFVLSVLVLSLGLSGIKKIAPGLSKQLLSIRQDQENNETDLKNKEDGVTKIISINSADQKALLNIPGVGPVISRRIIEYRKANGSFITIEDLQKVKGIGPKKFELIKKQISL